MPLPLVAAAAAGIKPKHVAYAVAGVGVLALAGAALWWLSTQEGKEERGRKPGDRVGAKLLVQHQGEAQRVWIGFGIGPGHQDPVTMTLDRWIGDWVEIPAHAEFMVVEVEVEGVFPSGLTEGVWVDCLKIVAKDAPPYSPVTHARRYSSDWDDEVYYVLESG